MPLFSWELLARLCSLATPFPSLIGRLCSQSEACLLACSEPVLVPKCSFLPPPGGALQHTLTGLGGGQEPGLHPGVGLGPPPTPPRQVTLSLRFPGVVCVEVSVAADLLVAGSDGGRMAVWNLEDRQLVHLLLGHTGGSPDQTGAPPTLRSRRRPIAEGAVRDIKVTDGATRCLSLADDRSLRGWSLVSGQQLLCLRDVLDSAPSSAHLHLFEPSRLLFVCSSTEVPPPGVRGRGSGEASVGHLCCCR